ncbi:hypothetical protein [Aestuariivirga sp.]|uniref:hypothetical protein n=1 Tax=Aestuariivirga sp. TaxID=2650926 RepID=UPI0039E6B907
MVIVEGICASHGAAFNGDIILAVPNCRAGRHGATVNSASRYWKTKRLWSLLEMINFQVGGLYHALRQLEIEERDMTSRINIDSFIPAQPLNSLSKLAGVAAPPSPAFKQPLKITTEDINRTKPFLKFIREAVCNGLGLPASNHRVQLFEGKLKVGMTANDFVAEARALREAIEGEIQNVYFYHYASDGAVALLSFDDTWGDICKKFPSVKSEAIAAVDCAALGHGTASVFHLMRIAEYGLRSLARERSVKLAKNRPLEWADWHSIIEAIDKDVTKIASRKPGKAREAALEFYRGVLGEFQAFKDVYRNNVMHTRRSYTQVEAQGILLRVRDFMGRLSKKIDENPKAIRWGKF